MRLLMICVRIKVVIKDLKVVSGADFRRDLAEIAIHGPDRDRKEDISISFVSAVIVLTCSVHNFRVCTRTCLLVLCFEIRTEIYLKTTQRHTG